MFVHSSKFFSSKPKQKHMQKSGFSRLSDLSVDKFRTATFLHMMASINYVICLYAIVDNYLVNSIHPPWMSSSKVWFLFLKIYVLKSFVKFLWTWNFKRHSPGKIFHSLLISMLFPKPFTDDEPKLTIGKYLLLLNTRISVNP